MSLSGWPAEVAARIEALELEPGAVAAFDADETLWDGDAGVGLLEWACREGHLLDPGAHARYLALREEDEGAALALCATAYAGLAPARVEELAEEFFAAGLGARIFPAMRALVDHLHGRDVRVHVVTASPAFAVLPGSRALGIPDQRVVGIELVREGDRYAAEVAGAITYRGYKATELRGRAGAPPVLAMGNGSNDAELLASATELAVAINPSEKGRADGAPSLAEEASARGWPVVRLAL